MENLPLPEGPFFLSLKNHMENKIISNFIYLKNIFFQNDFLQLVLQVPVCLLDIYASKSEIIFEIFLLVLARNL